jgi:hypothetical protein
MKIYVFSERDLDLPTDKKVSHAKHFYSPFEIDKEVERLSKYPHITNITKEDNRTLSYDYEHEVPYLEVETINGLLYFLSTIGKYDIETNTLDLFEDY